MRYASKRQYFWSPDISYSVGLIASDGCLQKDGRHIDLTSVDIDQLENFSLALGRVMKVTSKGNKISEREKPAYRIQFSDVAYYDFLLQAGLSPAKSSILSNISIPDAYYRDFLRGIFDGDGSCYSYMDKRWKSSHMYYVTFTTASKNFGEYLQMTNSLLAGVGKGSFQIGTRAYILSYAKADALKLFYFMYYDSHVIRLERKFKKLESFTLYGQNDIL